MGFCTGPYVVYTIVVLQPPNTVIYFTTKNMSSFVMTTQNFGLYSHMTSLVVSVLYTTWRNMVQLSMSSLEQDKEGWILNGIFGITCFWKSHGDEFIRKQEKISIFLMLHHRIYKNSKLQKVVCFFTFFSARFGMWVVCLLLVLRVGVWELFDLRKS